MSRMVNFNAVYAPSGDVVARKVQGEFIIIPITSGVGDLEGEIFTLNDTGKVIWDKLDGKKTLKDVAIELSHGFDTTKAEIEKDILGFTEELIKRKMIIERE